MSESLPEIILTASDDEYFAGLKPLVKSVQSQWNYTIVCIDLGMKERHLEWIESRNVQIHTLEEISSIPELSGETEYIWKLWIKPFFFQMVPAHRVVWIDSDAVVLRNLEKMFELLKAGPVFTTTGNNHEPARNKPELYEILPIDPHTVTKKFLNAGVFALDTQRERELLQAWTFCVRQGMEREEVRSAIRNNDQGALLWALHKLNLLDHITDTRIWNCLPNLPYRAPIPKIEDLGKGRKRYPQGSELLTKLREDHPHANIVHWCARPKIWELWQ